MHVWDGKKTHSIFVLQRDGDWSCSSTDSVQCSVTVTQEKILILFFDSLKLYTKSCCCRFDQHNYLDIIILTNSS
jgi:hypothetical protein